MKILFVDERYGGASHDSHIWNLSEMRRILSTRNARERSWLLGNYHKWRR